MAINMWSVLNLVAWTFGLYAVYALRALFDRRAKTWVFLTWAIWPCLLMEMAMVGAAYVPGLDFFSAATGVSSALFLWLAFRSLTQDVRADHTILLETDRWDARSATAYAIAAIGSLTLPWLTPLTASRLNAMAHLVEGATWLTVSGVLALILFTLRLPPVEARVYAPRLFAVAFTFAFAHSALPAAEWLSGWAVPIAIGPLLGTLFILTLVVAVYGLVLRIRGHKLATALERVHAMEEQLFGVEKVAAVSTLAAGAAHDFNNSLTVILGHVQLALDDPTIPATTRADLRIIEEAALSGARMAQELLGLTRQRTGSARFSNLADAVRTPLDSLAREFERRRFTVVANLESIPISNVDLEFICQICLNLYLNARDAMIPKGGGRLAVSLRRCDGFAEIVVQDSGTGIPEAFRSRIFQPLQTTKGERGTGLGLSVSRTQIRTVGGEITFETEEGVGSTFRVRLPLGKSSGLRLAHAPASVLSDVHAVS